MRSVRCSMWLAYLVAVSTLAVASTQHGTDWADLPLGAQASISATVGHDAQQYQIQPAQAGFAAENSPQHFSARFTPEGVEVSSGSANWRMTLRACGYGNALQNAAVAVPQAAANRVEYRRGACTEWYVNGPIGLEQGFTVNERPGHGSGQPLAVAMEISGNVMAASKGQDGLTLRSADGKDLLKYGGLIAYEATGKRLRAWQELRGNRLTLKVDDTGAKYPVVIDPWVQQAELTASDGEAGDMLGYSAAKSDSTVVIGAPAATINSNAKQGAVYLFFEPQKGWSNMTQTAKLTASDGQAGDMLGVSVYVCHSTVVAGMGPTSRGSKAYVYEEPTGGWTNMTETAQLTASDGVPGDNFASAVSISERTIAVGDSANSNSTQGAVYIFFEPVNGWTTMTETAKLTASDGQQGDLFGTSVATNQGTIVVVGATQADNQRGGAAYVYLKPSTGWVTTSQENAELTASDRGAKQNFGQAVAANGPTIVAGSKGSTGKGAAYVFIEPQGGWANATETAKLINPLGQSTNCFSCSVAVSGGMVPVGAPNAASGSGIVYLFRKPASGWKTTSHYYGKLTASDHKKGALFGYALGFDGILAVGSSKGGSSGQGTAYVFGP